MLEESRNVSEGNSSVIVYEGFLTKLVTVKLNYSVPYYTKLRVCLVQMGCMKQLKRGGGTAPSQWEMIYEPTYEAFVKAIEAEQPEPDHSPPTRVALLEQRVNEMSDHINGIDRWRDAVNDILAEHFGTEEVQQDDHNTGGSEAVSEVREDG
jgi:hypothetical protein